MISNSSLLGLNGAGFVVLGLQSDSATSGCSLETHTYCTYTQFHSSSCPFLVHWKVNEWSDRLIDLRCVNGSSLGEKVCSCSLLFYNLWLIHAFIYLCVCVFFLCETIFCPVLITPLSLTDSLKWLIGCSGLCFFIYLFWNAVEWELAYGNMISLFSILKFIRHMSLCCSLS